MKYIVLLLSFSFSLASCSSKPTYDPAMLEKYPACHHINMKIYQMCIQKNEAGVQTSALDLENNAYPGQFK